MNETDLMLIIILLLLVIYIYQKQENLLAESEQEAIRTTYCVSGKETDCIKDSLCFGDDIVCNKLCISGNSEPLEPGMQKCL